MAENKKGFILYADLIHTVEHLTNEQAGKLLKHTLEYVNDRNPETDDQLLKILFEPIKQQLKRDLRKFEDKKEERSEAGHLGNLKRWNKDLYKKVVSKKLTLTDALTIANNRKTSLSDKSIANVAVNDTVNVTVKDINNIPDLETFMLYLKDYLKKEPDRYDKARTRLIDTYNAWKENNWKDGNDKKIKNWKTKAIMQLRYIK